MELEQAVLTRRSATRLTGPAPSDEELNGLVSLAMTAPDHGRLTPWRLITLRGEAREALGELFALATHDPSNRERAAAKPLRAPLLVSLVFSPQEHPKVPEWEQLAAAVCAAHTLMLLLQDRGWGSIWRTGTMAQDPGVRRLLGLADTEQLLGWLYVGKADIRGTIAPRPSPAPHTKVSALRAPARSR